MKLDPVLLVGALPCTAVVSWWVFGGGGSLRSVLLAFAVGLILVTAIKRPA